MCRCIRFFIFHVFICRMKKRKRAPPRGGGGTDKLQDFHFHAFVFGSYGNCEEEKGEALPQEGGGDAKRMNSRILFFMFIFLYVTCER